MVLGLLSIFQPEGGACGQIIKMSPKRTLSTTPSEGFGASEPLQTTPSEGMGPSRHLSTTPSEGMGPSRPLSTAPSESKGFSRHLSTTPSEDAPRGRAVQGCSTNPSEGFFKASKLEPRGTRHLAPQSFFPFNQPFRGVWSLQPTPPRSWWPDGDHPQGGGG